ncbi:MAG: Slp family lipoprotein [Syntrophales bacterium]
MGRKRLYLLCYGLLMIFGCSGPVISTEIRHEAVPIKGFAEVRQNPEQFKNSTIILGGEIIGTINHENEASTLLVLDRPLDDSERPEKWDNSEGRFMVHTSYFLDPEIYTKGREVTVAGTVTGIERAPVGKTDYPYVALTARQIYLWSPRYPPYAYPSYPYWSPDWYPDRYSGFWGPPWWGPPPEPRRRWDERDSGPAPSKVPGPR